MWNTIADICSTSRGALEILYVGSDSLIFVSYFAIPALIAHVFHKRRQDLPFHWLFVLFALFIFSCGTTHLAHVWTNLVGPVPWTDGWIRAFTALVSTATALTLWMNVPAVMTYPTATQFRRLNDELEDRVLARTAELEQALREKEVLLNEVHHRVKNNLQVIVSMLNLQAQQISQQAAMPFNDVKARIYSMARIHEQLQNVSDPSGFNLAPFLTELGRHLEELYGAEGRIRFRVQTLPIRVHFDQATPLALVLTEIISNAYKHAFPDGREGTICIDMKATPSGVLIRIADDGVGVSSPNPRSGGMGSMIIKALSLQLGAKTVSTGRDGTGTAVTIDLPWKMGVAAEGAREVSSPRGAYAALVGAPA